jgi:hypothetical protein
MREGFYRAYKTKQEAKNAARELRKPKNCSRLGYGYPVTVVISYIKNFYLGGHPAWGVYIYKRR